MGNKYLAAAVEEKEKKQKKRWGMSKQKEMIPNGEKMKELLI